MPFVTLLVFCINANGQILDSARIKHPKLDTLIFITQHDVDDYLSLKNIKDTVGKFKDYVGLVKAIRINQLSFNLLYEGAVKFTERNEALKAAYNATVTQADVVDYLEIRKIVGDTTGKTADYLKIIKSAKFRVAEGKYMGGLYKEISYENALIEAEENFRRRNLIDKVLVVKHLRKMYLQKKGKTIKTYNIGLGPNPIGQKEREGDGKTPEGIYILDWQKWNSTTFHSFHISYPNKIDSARAKMKGLVPGSFIMVHGTSKGVKKKKDWTNGCIALNNVDMLEFRNMVFPQTPIEITK